MPRCQLLTHVKSANGWPPMGVRMVACQHRIASPGLAGFCASTAPVNCPPMFGHARRCTVRPTVPPATKALSGGALMRTRCVFRANELTAVLIHNVENPVADQVLAPFQL